MQREVEVRTGEAVAIRYELAGLGSRFLALVIDMLAQAAILLVLGLAIGIATPALMRIVPFANKVITAWTIAAGVIVFFAIVFGWFIIFEIWWSGRTPGKRALGLRVLRDGGFPLDPGAAVIRNLIRVVEALLGFYAFSAASTLISRENKRLGDFAAGTIVVRERADTIPDLDAYLSRPARTDTGLNDADRVLIERFLARRATLDPAARFSLARQIAARVRPTLRANYDGVDDESLLEFLTSTM